MGREISKKVFQDVIDVLNGMRLYYWIDYGTLLGAIRDHDFIGSDMDIDISIVSHFSQDYENILNALRDKGLVFSPDYFNINGEYYMRKANIIVNDVEPGGGFVKVELVPQYLIQDVFYKLTKWDDKNLYGAGTPKIFLEKFATILFKDRYVQIPDMAEELLEYYYGDWKTPRIDIAQSYKDDFTLLDPKDLEGQLI